MRRGNADGDIHLDIVDTVVDTDSEHEAFALHSTQRLGEKDFARGGIDTEELTTVDQVQSGQQCRAADEEQ